MQPGALPFPRKELSPREALAVCTPPAPMQEAAAHFFRAMEWADAYIESLFLGGPYLRVDYERLAQNVQAQADVVFDYLGVGKRPVETATRKQLTVPKEDLVVNYHELL